MHDTLQTKFTEIFVDVYSSWFINFTELSFLIGLKTNFHHYIPGKT